MYGDGFPAHWSSPPPRYRRRCDALATALVALADKLTVGDPADTAKVSTDEIFGPVICLYTYTDRDQAIKAANSLDVHFQAAVMVNDHTAFRADWMPFGGRGSSGLGMGGIPYSIHEMTREKLMVIKNPGL
jgi:acyl-CoA reductase-like NAD-dependent aldehyde dehydrogenase